jgi:hypothetical protein
MGMIGVLSSYSVIYLYKAQKEAENHLITDAAKAQDASCVALLHNINHVTFGKCCPWFSCNTASNII